MTPRVLLHASLYQNPFLMPGINYTNKKITWDDTESNEWLYAGVNERDVLLQGYSAYLEKKYNAVSVKMRPSKVIITLESPVEIIIPPTIYLYIIHPGKDDGWRPVGNKINKDFDEYKTNKKIKYTTVSSVVLNDALFRKWGLRRVMRMDT